jgi:hypothetical protein
MEDIEGKAEKECGEEVRGRSRSCRRMGYTRRRRKYRRRRK